MLSSCLVQSPVLILDESILAINFSDQEAFDFIHQRAVAGAIKDWERLLKQIYDNLKPGGIIEM